MLGIAGGMALLLGVAGIYGVISYSVSQRSREIGIRIALGAQPGSVRQMFVKHGLILAVVGVAIGLAAATGTMRLISSLLFHVNPVDPMGAERKREIQRVRELFDKAGNGEADSMYRAFRAVLALRPAPKDLVSEFMRRRLEFAGRPDEGDAFTTRIRETARRLSGASERASDPDHPVGAAAARIRQALPPFQEWTLDVAAAAAHLLSSPGDDRDRLKSIMPPGFAEGRPGAFLRASRGLVLAAPEANAGSVRTTYQLLQDSPDSAAFRAGLAAARVSDVLDFTWMVVDPIELRSVQELLEQLTASVLPRAATRFVQYDEPRYRSALRLHIADEVAPAAIGGVLAGWQGCPPGVDAAHVRFFLEPWATVQSGQAIDFDRLPLPFRPL